MHNYCMFENIYCKALGTSCVDQCNGKLVITTTAVQEDINKIRQKERKNVINNEIIINTGRKTNKNIKEKERK